MLSIICSNRSNLPSPDAVDAVIVPKLFVKQLSDILDFASSRNVSSRVFPASWSTYNCSRIEQSTFDITSLTASFSIVAGSLSPYNSAIPIRNWLQKLGILVSLVNIKFLIFVSSARL